MKIDHIGIAVNDLDRALEFYRDTLGLTVSEVVSLPERGLTIAFLPLGEALLELMAPLGEKSEIARFLERRGEGIHHLCLGAPGLADREAKLRNAGVRLVWDRPQLGAEGRPVQFIHPSATHGVLLELAETEAE